MTKRLDKRTAEQDHARIRWVWRCNAAINDEPNETTDREDHAQFLFKQLEPYCGAFAFQLESAPTTGYLHYQGCMELTNKKRKHWILNNIRAFEYLAPMQGTPKQAWNYATKLDTRMAGPWTYGEPYGENQKKPVQEFVEAVCKGMTDMDLVDQHPSSYLRYDADKIRQAKRIRVPCPTRKELYGDEEMEVYVFYGDPGTGKSYAARHLYPEIYTPPIQTNRHGTFWLTAEANCAPVVLLDDFDGCMTLKALNQLLDPYPQLMQKKGGQVWWIPKIVILTTNVMPGYWYNFDNRQNVRTQINRRITYCFDFNTPEGKAMTKGMTVEELETKYKEICIPDLQRQANQRMGGLPPIRFNPTGGKVMTSYSQRRSAVRTPSPPAQSVFVDDEGRRKDWSDVVMWDEFGNQ